jgi:hypothetical protein
MPCKPLDNAGLPGGLGKKLTSKLVKSLKQRFVPGLQIEVDLI